MRKATPAGYGISQPMYHHEYAKQKRDRMRKDAERVFNKACIFLETRLEKGKFSSRHSSHCQAVGILIGYREINPERADKLLKRCKDENTNPPILERINEKNEER